MQRSCRARATIARGVARGAAATDGSRCQRRQSAADTRIYPRSLELVRLSHAVIAALPPGYGFLADQLRRASSSVVLNFAEGTGKRAAADRRRYLHTARGAACEASACFDLALAFGAMTAEQHAAASDLCDHLAAMLTRFAEARR